MLFYIIFAVSAVAFPIRTTIRSNRILNSRQEISILQYQSQRCQHFHYKAAIKRKYVHIFLLLLSKLCNYCDLLIYSGVSKKISLMQKLKVLLQQLIKVKVKVLKRNPRISTYSLWMTENQILRTG